MKVLCIDNIWTGDSFKEYPKMGSIYTVRKEVLKHENTDWYELEELYGWWEQVGFVPLSTIDENEMIREYKTQTV